MVATLTSPNGAVSGLVMRRRVERITYPESADAYAESGFDPERWNPDGVGFWAKVVASISGMDERNELKSRLAFLRTPNDQSREDYFRELSWRVPEWGFSTENVEGEIAIVAAPGEGDGNWEAFDLLPYGVGAWLVERVRTIHLPKRKPWRTETASEPPLTTDTPILTPTLPDPTPPPS